MIPANTPLENQMNKGVEYWVRTGFWPKAYIEQDPGIRKIEISRFLAMKGLLPKHKALVSWEPSEPRSVRSDIEDQDNHFTTILSLKRQGSFMGTLKFTIDNENQKLCSTLINSPQELPRESLFDHDIFQETCQRVASRKKPTIIRDILPLIAPPAEIHALHTPQFQCLIESVNETWGNSQPIIHSYPKPTYSVGFRREAFTEEQLDIIAPIVGDFIGEDQSLFMATSEIYFPFFTCEVSTKGLQHADCQNIHSMTLAVRAIVELFRLIDRESELHLQILAFSISHNHEEVRIYGHYPVINKATAKTTYYRHLIRKYYFTNLDGGEKWFAYRFTLNVYDIWAPMHLKRICSAINQIRIQPELEDLSSLPEIELSQELENNQSAQLNTDSASSKNENSITDTSSSAPIMKRKRVR